MNKRQTREEKIKFLKGLITGENKIHELQPMQHLVLHFINETQTYQCKELNREFTKEELKEYQKRNHLKACIIVHEIISPFPSGERNPPHILS